MQAMNSRNDQLTVIIYEKLHFILQKQLTIKLLQRKRLMQFLVLAFLEFFSDC